MKRRVAEPGSTDEMWIEWVPLRELATWPSNPKAHDHATLGESFERFGFIDPIIVDEGTGKIVAGHGRRERLLQMQREGLPAPDRVRVRADGEWLVPVLRGIHFESEHEAEAYLLANNQITIRGGYDDSALLTMLERHDDLTGIGWSDEEVEALSKRVAEVEAPEAAPLVELQEDGEELPELPTNAVTKPGDLWQLGNHRLICGDARRRDIAARVLGSDVPFIMVTDPPYGVEYDPEWRAERGLSETTRVAPVANDDQASWKQAYSRFPGVVAYVWCASLKSDVVIGDLEACGLLRRAQIIWNKGSLVIGRGHYHWQHEPCWYTVRKGETAAWCGGRDKSTVWDIPNLTRGRGANEDTVTAHSTQKPVACMGRPLQHHGKAGDFVYEPFAGSGTTIIAAEQLDRRCLAIECDPAWCDVIVERWQKLSGAQAKRIGHR